MTRATAYVLAFGLGVVCLCACETTARTSAEDRDASSDSGLPFDAGIDGGGVHDSGPEPPRCGTACVENGGDCSICDCCEPLVCDDGKCATCIGMGHDCGNGGACCPSADPLKGVECDSDWMCAECSGMGGPCTSDRSCCWGPPYLMCSDQSVCVIRCWEDKDCAAAEVCVSTEVCLPTPCSADSECAGRRCCAGQCVDDCGYGPASACAIVTRGGVVSDERTTQLLAVATNTEGDMVLGQAVVWTVSDESKVKVDAGGIASGQGVAGETKASAKIGGLDCGSVTVTNLPPRTPGKVRVVVADRETGRPVPGAYVVVGSGAPIATTAEGIAESDPAPGGIHVFHADYSYVSILGAALDDYLVHLTPVEKEAGGYRARFDFSLFKERMREGLAGCSIADAFELGTPAFWGEPLLTYTKASAAEGFPFNYEGWAVEDTGVGLALQTSNSELKTVKDSFSTCAVGHRSAWAFGLDVNLNMLTEIIDSGASNYIAIARHALVPFFAVEPLPLVPTPTDDSVYQRPISKKPFIPDYDHFPGLEMEFRMPFMIDTAVSMPIQPKSGDNFVRDVLAFEGVYVPQMGFVPLAYAQNSDLSNPRDGIVDETDSPVGEVAPGHVRFKAAPPYRGLEGHGFMTVLMALDWMGGTTGPTLDDPPSPVSAIISRAESLSPSLDLSMIPFLGFAQGALLDRATRELGPAPVEGASLLRYAIEIAYDRSWHVYVSPGIGEPISLPPVPAGLPDISTDSGMTVHAASMRDGLAMDALFSTNSAIHPDDMLPVVERVSSLPCYKRYLPSDRWYNDRCLTTHPHPACEPSCELLK